jgi:hypothetical protein
VNVVNVLNILIQPPQRETYYAIQLSELSREILKARGMNEGEITVKEVTSLSKHLARIFETRLGFTIRIGKARRREVLIPAEWLNKKEQPNLFDFLKEEPHKDVQNVHNVHPESTSSTIEKS